MMDDTYPLGRIRLKDTLVDDYMMEPDFFSKEGFVSSIRLLCGALGILLMILGGLYWFLFSKNDWKTSMGWLLIYMFIGAIVFLFTKWLTKKIEGRLLPQEENRYSYQHDLTHLVFPILMFIIFMAFRLVLKNFSEMRWILLGVTCIWFMIYQEFWVVLIEVFTIKNLGYVIDHAKAKRQK